MSKASSGTASVAEVDSYQCQRYIPIVGWQNSHYTSPSYSNSVVEEGTNGGSTNSMDAMISSFEKSMTSFLLGDNSTIANNQVAKVASPSTGDVSTGMPADDMFPSIVLPTGWSYKDKWRLDSSNTFGEPDKEGWLYAHSFDKLFEMIKSGTATSVSTTTSIVRARRWVHSIVCTSADVEHKIQERIATIQSNLLKLGNSLDEKKMHVKLIHEYEKLRGQRYEEAYQTFTAMVNNTLEVLQYQATRLEKFKQFLVDRAIIENTYASGLEMLATKYCYSPGSPMKSRSKPIASSGGTATDGTTLSVREDDSFMVVEDATRSGTSSTGNQSNDFPFSKLGLINDAISKRLSFFSSFITTSLVSEIDVLLLETHETLHECKDDISKHRSDYIKANEVVKRCLKSLDAVHDSVSSMIVSNIALLSDELVQCKSGTKRSANSSIVSEESGDLWLSAQRYRRAVAVTETTMMVLSTKSRRLASLQASLIARVSSLFVSSVELFANEQARTWTESGNLVLDMCKDIINSLQQIQKEGAVGTGDTAVITANKLAVDDFKDNLLGQLPSIPRPTNIIMSGPMLLTSSSALKRTPNYRVGLKWLMVHAVATPDGYLHILSSKGVELPSKSLYLKQCEVVQASDVNGSIPNAIEIKPLQDSLINLITMSGRKKKSAFTYQDGIVLYNTDADVAFKWLTTLKDPFVSSAYPEEVLGVDEIVLSTDGEEASSRSDNVSSHLPGDPYPDNDAGDVDEFLISSSSTIRSPVPANTSTPVANMFDGEVTFETNDTASYGDDDLAPAVRDDVRNTSPIAASNSEVIDSVDTVNPSESEGGDAGKRMSVRDRASFFKNKAYSTASDPSTPAKSVVRSGIRKSFTIQQYEEGLVKSKEEISTRVSLVKEQRVEEAVTLLADVVVEERAKLRERDVKTTPPK